MSEPYLIAHMVRGVPAFDIATPILCSHCQRWDSAEGKLREPREEPYPANLDCTACEGTGFWLILKTHETQSGGTRAFPYWKKPLNDVLLGGLERLTTLVPPAPNPWPDLYPECYTAMNKHVDDWGPNAAKPGYGKITNLAERLGLIPKPSTITRR